jgi:hypothetical protein
VEAVRRVVSAFLKKLRDRIYPEFARQTRTNPEYWVMGSKLETWQLRSDPDKRFTPLLMAWAQEFNVQGADWILEGTLQTLSYWHQCPARQAALDISGFRPWNAIQGIVSAEDCRFAFSDSGWDPTSSSFASWRANVREKFKGVWLLWNDAPFDGIKPSLILFDLELPIAIKIS